MDRELWKRRGTIYVLSALVGVVAGVGAILFSYLSSWVAWMVLGRTLGYMPPGPSGEPPLFDGGLPPQIWILGLVFAPAIGNLIASALTTRFAPEASGHGTDAVIDAFHNKRGVIRGPVPFVKGLATAVCLGFGGSGGREGPIAQIGAGFGSFVGGWMRLRPRQRRILLAAGMGAGIAAVFRAPLAGALFAAEILYRDAELEADVLMPAFISCSISYCTYCGWFGDFGTLFSLSRALAFEDLSELLPYTVLALSLVPLVWLFVRGFYGVEQYFSRLPGPRPLKAALGGLLCGAVAVGAWQLTGSGVTLSCLSHGYGVLQNALDGGLTSWNGVQLLMGVALLKIVTTSLTISSGGSGGVFGPSMVIGGAMGGAVGVAANQLGWAANPGCFVIVGMCGFFAGAANTPISTIIMVSEMTGSHELLMPAMWVCMITYLLTGRWALYRKQVLNSAFSAAHRGRFLKPLLEGMFVRDVIEQERSVVTVTMATPLRAILRLVADTHADYFPTLDAAGRFVGIFSAHDVRTYTYDEAMMDLVVAQDLMTVSPICLTPDDDLHTALNRFNHKKLDELPVVDSQDPTKFITMLRHRAITRAYDKALDALRAIQAQEI